MKSLKWQFENPSIKYKHETFFTISLLDMWQHVIWVLGSLKGQNLDIKIAFYSFFKFCPHAKSKKNPFKILFENEKTMARALHTHASCLCFKVFIKLWSLWLIFLPINLFVNYITWTIISIHIASKQNISYTEKLHFLHKLQDTTWLRHPYS